MKKEVIGNKRFSKKTIVIAEEGDSFQEWFIESLKALGLTSKIKGDKIIFGQTFEESLVNALEYERQILIDKGLPYTSIVWKIPAEQKGEFSYESIRPDDGKDYESISLMEYISLVKGFDIGSLEFLSALILESMERLLQQKITPEEGKRLEEAYRLGENIFKRKVYASELNRLTDNAKKPRSRLTSLIEQLSKRHETPKELWYSLITMMDNEGMDPEERKDEKGKPIIHYWKDDKNQDYIKYKRFSDRLAEFRKKTR